MPVTEISHRRRVLARMIGSGFAGVAFAATVLAASPAVATADELTRVEAERSEPAAFIPPALAYCLNAAADLDSMYPGIHPSEVKLCLKSASA